MKTPSAPARRARRASRASWTGIVTSRPSRCACAAPLACTLAKMDAIGAPAPRRAGASGKQHDQSPRPRDAHQAPQQTPARAGSEAVVAQDDAAARRQQSRELGHSRPSSRSSLNSQAFGNIGGDRKGRGWRRTIALSIGASRARATRGIGNETMSEAADRLADVQAAYRGRGKARAAARRRYLPDRGVEDARRAGDPPVDRRGPAPFRRESRAGSRGEMARAARRNPRCRAPPDRPAAIEQGRGSGRVVRRDPFARPQLAGAGASPRRATRRASSRSCSSRSISATKSRRVAARSPTCPRCWPRRRTPG